MVVVETTEEHVLTVRGMDARPSITNTEGTAHNIDNKDVEQSPKTSEVPDPYAFRNGLKSEDELAQLRRTKLGKRLEGYQRKQNDLIEALLKPMEEHTEDARVEEEATRLPVSFYLHINLGDSPTPCKGQNRHLGKFDRKL
ncbi:hypothetical protein PHLCEN_2v11550 [Hermanssonia centrifuga]|uniref:Uncharacterized protein n=1 Tax=Hermanssonia centrifuga TaxID=98765 RepID=A0A2R6NJK9_9APHY|nr:hypothetical protein PHLCEN_2v11550 [Hermanssonia centrifuga]